MPNTVAVHLSGPLFDGPVTPRIQQAIQHGVLQAALLGQRLVQEQLRPGHGVKTGNFRRSIVGVAGSWRSGTVESPLIYAGWLETGERRGRQTRFTGYHMFENAASNLEGEGLAALFEQTVATALGGG